MIRASSILSRTLAATRVGSAASFAVPNRFLQAVHYSSSSSSSSRHPIVRLLQRYKFSWKPAAPVLYQTQVLPYSKIVRVFLDYHDVPYKVVEVDPISMKEISWSKYQGLPILIVDGEQLNGASAIIGRLRQKFRLKEKTDSTSVDFEEIEWRNWAEGCLFSVVLINMFGTVSETLKSMDYILSHHNFMVKFVWKYTGAQVYYSRFKNMGDIHDRRAALYEAAETWVDALYGREFRGGSKPNLADMAVFGVLRPMHYMKCGKDTVEHTRIGEWYTRMENAVGKSSMIEVSTRIN